MASTPRWAEEAGPPPGDATDYLRFDPYLGYGRLLLAQGRLREAVRMAAPEEYYRAFLDEGSQVFVLLPEVRDAGAAFVDQPLEFAGAPEAAPSSVPRLIAAGLSNREIAEELVVAA
jgi:hypothetical protein